MYHSDQTRRSSLEDADYEFPSVIQRLPLKRFEVAIHKLTVVAVPLHLELLNQHKSNISKFQRLSEWQKLDRELINASRTVQQLKADIHSMDIIRNQIVECDHRRFDLEISETKMLTLNAVQEFIELHQEVTQPIIRKQSESLENDTSLENQKEYLDMLNFHAELQCSEKDNNIGVQVLSDVDIASAQEQTQQQIHASSKLSHSWSDLKNSLEGLNEMIHGFCNQVHDQQQHVDSIQNNIESADENVKTGVTSLSKAAKLKMAIAPVAGAVIGGCAGGPIGLFLGVKIGMAAAVGASIVGYQTGKVLKNKQAKSTDVEMMKLSTGMSRSTSLPEVMTDSET